MENMKVQCVKCKSVEELTTEEIEEIAEFVLKNNLEASDYLNYLAIMRGKKCDGNKKHAFVFEEKWQDALIKLTRDRTDLMNKKTSTIKSIDELTGKIKELEFQLDNKQKELSDLEISESKFDDELIKSTGDDNWNLWK